MTVTFSHPEWTPEQHRLEFTRRIQPIAQRIFNRLLAEMEAEDAGEPLLSSSPRSTKDECTPNDDLSGAIEGS